jgi:hypothetical protein
MKVADVVEIVAIVFTGVAALFAWLSARAARESASTARQSLDLSGITRFIAEEYESRRFDSIPIPGLEGPSSLKEVRLLALRQYEEDAERWDVESQVGNTWQNEVAYEIALMLEQIGVAVFTGLVPLRMVLALYGARFVKDWLLCRSWVRSYQDRAEMVSHHISYHRRHGEWLALVAAMWMDENWTYPNSKRVLSECGGTDGARARISDLSKVDETLMPRSVQEDIKELVGVEL